MLFGDWRNVANKKNNIDLTDLRNTAKAILQKDTGPAQLKDFLNSNPKNNAFEDFKYWDTVINTGFGGHNFKKLI